MTDPAKIPPAPKKHGRPRKIQPVMEAIVESKPLYTISLDTGGQKYESSGETPYLALSTLPKPQKLMQKGLLSVAHGAFSRQVCVTPLLMKRLFFTSRGLIEIKAKQVFMNL